MPSLSLPACNIRLYHLLPLELSLSLIAEHYNPRVVGMDGAPTPFSEEEIVKQYQKAEQRGMYPTLGVSDPKAKRRVASLALNKEVRSFLRHRTAQGGSCTPSDLLNAFISFRGGIAINPIAFGRAVVGATGINRSTPFGVPTYKGFHLLQPGVKKRRGAKGSDSRDRSGVKE